MCIIPDAALYHILSGHLRPAGNNQQGYGAAVPVYSRREDKVKTELSAARDSVS